MESISQGLPIKHAAASSGLNYSTVCQWLNPRCAIHDPRFEEGFDKAHAFAVKRNIKRINASRDWKAAAFWLERNTPEFAPKSMHQHQVNQSAQGEDGSEDSARAVSIAPRQLAKLTAAHERMMAKLSNKAKPNDKETKHNE